MKIDRDNCLRLQTQVKTNDHWVSFLGYYRAVLLKGEFFITIRVAESQQSFDIEESCFSKNILFLVKNDFLFYYLKL